MKIFASWIGRPAKPSVSPKHDRLARTDCTGMMERRYFFESFIEIRMSIDVSVLHQLLIFHIELDSDVLILAVLEIDFLFRNTFFKLYLNNQRKH